jgi:hypothetical protein
MILDITFFGYGVGLVMLGWISGMIVSIVCSIVRGVSSL